ncbi:hypothetical protein DXG01_014123 [Tephrocybe rancida]|nr:hypothetical protein DXG01_014123 [Tephrocybe rancida]
MSYRLIRHSSSPYIRPLSLNLCKQKRLQNLKVELDGFNNAKCPVTYDIISRGWVLWQRPIRFLQNGGMTDIAASGFEHEHYTHPMCPHTGEDQEMALHLQKHFRINKHINFFWAIGHACNFMVVIPCLKEPVITQDPVMIAEQQAIQDDDKAAEMQEQLNFDQDYLAAPFLSPSEDEVAELLALQQLPSPPLSSKAIEKFGEFAENIVINHQVPTMFYTPTKEAAPRPVPPSSSRASYSPRFFDCTVADTCANLEHELIVHAI